MKITKAYAILNLYLPQDIILKISLAAYNTYKGVLVMKQYPTESIKNLALLGHAGSGKTTVADAMLFAGKKTDRIGKTADGTTIMDYDPEEKKRGTSVLTSVYPLEWNDKKINILDAPGLFDFASGVREALTAAESALIVLSGKSGLTVGAEQCFELAREQGKAAAFFVSKLDSSHAHFYRIISILAGRYGAVICPVFIPVVEGDHVVSYVNLVNGKGYTFDGVKPNETVPGNDENIEAMRAMMLEAVASADEELMEKYFSGETFTEEEILKAMKECSRIAAKNGISDMMLEEINEEIGKARAYICISANKA